MEKIQKKAVVQPTVESDQILKLNDQIDQKNHEVMAWKVEYNKLHQKYRTASEDAKSEREMLEFENMLLKD